MFKLAEGWKSKRIMTLDIATYSTGLAAYVPGAGLFCHDVQSFADYPYERYKDQHIQVKMYYQKYKPEYVIFEAGFGSERDTEGTIRYRKVTDRGEDVVTMLAEVRGAIIAAFPKDVCHLIKVANTEWKSWLGIHNAADLSRDRVKHKVYEIVCQKWDIDFPITHWKGKAKYDMTDAVGMMTGVLEGKLGPLIDGS